MHPCSGPSDRATDTVKALDHATAHALANHLTVDTTTTGRRTGETRSIEIWLLGIDGRSFITGTPGRRDWLANPRADPNLVVHLKQAVPADLPARAVEVTDDATRHWVLTHEAAHWYRGQTPIGTLVAAPMVEPSFAEDG